MSSQIEGAGVSVSDIILHDSDEPSDGAIASERDIQEAFNYAEAIKSAIQYPDAGGTIDRDRICALHKQLIVDHRDENKCPDEVRDIPVKLGADNDTSNVRFIPAHPAHVSIHLDQLVSYIQISHLP